MHTNLIKTGTSFVLTALIVAWCINAYYISMYWVDKMIAGIEVMLTLLILAGCIHAFLQNTRRFYYFKVVFFCLIIEYCAYIIYGMFILDHPDSNLWYGFWLLSVAIIALTAGAISVMFYLFDYYSKTYTWVFSILLAILSLTAGVLEGQKILVNSLFSSSNLPIFFIFFNFVWCISHRIYRFYQNPNKQYQINFNYKKILVVVVPIIIVVGISYWLFPLPTLPQSDEGVIAVKNPRIDVASKIPLPKNNFVLLQNLPSITRTWEYFTIKDTSYLLSTIASPNTPDDAQELRNLFKFDPIQFKFLPDARLIPSECSLGDYADWIRMDNVYSWRYFTVNNQPAIVMANHNSMGKSWQFNCSKDTYWTKSYVLLWNGNGFNEQCAPNCMYIPTDSPMKMEFYTIGDDSYLAVAEQDLAGKSGASIFRWNNGENKFEKTKQPNLEIPHSTYIEAFQDNSGTTYLIFSLGGQNEDVVVYSVDEKGQLHLSQSAKVTPDNVIAHEGFTQSSSVFKIVDTNGNNQIYLLIGYAVSGFAMADSWLYRWEHDDKSHRYLFKRYQHLDVTVFKNTVSYAPYTIDNTHYIGAAVGINGAYGYQWNAELAQLDKEYSHVLYSPTADTYVNALTPFYISDNTGTNHLLMALAIGGPKTDESPLLLWGSMPNEKIGSSPYTSQR